MQMSERRATTGSAAGPAVARAQVATLAAPLATTLDETLHDELALNAFKYYLDQVMATENVSSIS